MSDEKNTIVSRISAFLQDEFALKLDDYQRDALAALVNGLSVQEGAGMKHEYFICHLRASHHGTLFPVLDGNGSDDWINSIYDAEKRGMSVVAFRIPHRRAFFAVRTIERFLQAND